MGTIKQLVNAIINATPRLQADVFGNEWPAHSHAMHTGLDADDHLHYMTNAAGATRHHTGDVYFDERIISDDNLRFDDAYRLAHTTGAGDWDQAGIDLSASAAEWQDLYDAAGGIVSLIEAITMGITGPGGGGGVTLDGAYDWGGSGAGRSIVADSGAVDVTVSDASNNAAMVLNQDDVTNNPNILEIYGTGPGHSIYLYGGAQDIYGEGALYIRSGGNVNLQPTANMTFTDGHRSGSTYTSSMPFSDNTAEWDAAYAILGGTGSLLALAMSGGGTLDDSYDYGGSGSGRSVTVDSGSVALTVPGAGTDSALSLTNLNSSNTSEVISIYNDATISTGYSILMQGAAGGGGTDYDEFGHFIWTEGSVTIGHGTGTGDDVRRSYTVYDYNNDAAVNWASTEMRAEADTGYSQYASVICKAGNYGALSARVDIETTGYIAIDSTLSTSLTSGGTMTFDSSGVLRFSDANRSGSSWTSSYMNLSTGTEWSDIETLIGSEGTLFGAILAAASGGGSVSEPDTQIVWGNGTGVDSDSYLTYENSAHVLTINGRLNLNNASWGTIGSASFASNTITVDFSTDKDIQTVNITDNATDLDITAPTGGTAKGLVLKIWNTSSPARTIGGSGWSDVQWEDNGPDLVTETVSIDGTSIALGAHVVLSFTYDGSSWNGWVSEFKGVPV